MMMMKNKNKCMNRKEKKMIINHARKKETMKKNVEKLGNG